MGDSRGLQQRCGQQFAIKTVPNEGIPDLQHNIHGGGGDSGGSGSGGGVVGSFVRRGEDGVVSQTRR